MINSEILHKASTYVSSLLSTKLKETYFYHNLDHTLDVVDNVAEISQGLTLNDRELEIILLAAWFHDTGYTISPREHEATSADIARKFLTREKYPSRDIQRIVGCIKATKVPQRPKNTLEMIVCDADLLYLGKRHCLEKAELLRLEFEHNRRKPIPESDWLQESADFFQHHHFHLPSVRKKYDPERIKNISRITLRLKRIGMENGSAASRSISPVKKGIKLHS